MWRDCDGRRRIAEAMARYTYCEQWKQAGEQANLIVGGVVVGAMSWKLHATGIFDECGVFPLPTSPPNAKVAGASRQRPTAWGPTQPFSIRFRQVPILYLACPTSYNRYQMHFHRLDSCIASSNRAVHLPAHLAPVLTPLARLATLPVSETATVTESAESHVMFHDGGEMPQTEPRPKRAPDSQQEDV